jgi:hypothetical protein
MKLKKLKLLGLLLQHPIDRILDGLRAQREKQFKKAIVLQYGIAQLPTVDLLELFGEFEEELSTYSFLQSTSQITDLMILKKFAKCIENCDYF